MSRGGLRKRPPFLFMMCVAPLTQKHGLKIMRTPELIAYFRDIPFDSSQDDVKLKTLLEDMPQFFKNDEIDEKINVRFAEYFEYKISAILFPVIRDLQQTAAIKDSAPHKKATKH